MTFCKPNTHFAFILLFLPVQNYHFVTMATWWHRGWLIRWLPTGLSVSEK